MPRLLFGVTGLLRDEACANTRAFDDGGELLGVAAAGDDAFDAAVDGVLHGAEFGFHAAGAVAALGFGGVMDNGIDVFDDGDRTFAGFRCIAQEAGGAGEEDEDVGFPKEGDLRGELVVVTEAEFFDGDAVVLVDDGDDLFELKELGERALHALGAVGIGEVFVGEQELRDVQSVIAQQRFIRVHEMGLTDGGAGLQRSHVGGACGQFHGTQAGGDGSAADDDAGMSGLFEQGDGFDEFAQLHGVGLHAVEFREDAGTEFEDDAFACGHAGA